MPQGGSWEGVTTTTTITKAIVSSDCCCCCHSSYSFRHWIWQWKWMWWRPKKIRNWEHSFNRVVCKSYRDSFWFLHILGIREGYEGNRVGDVTIWKKSHGGKKLNTIQHTEPAADVHKRNLVSYTPGTPMLIFFVCWRHRNDYKPATPRNSGSKQRNWERKVK